MGDEENPVLFLPDPALLSAGAGAGQNARVLHLLNLPPEAGLLED
jgi:hypothetical protein